MTESRKPTINGVVTSKYLRYPNPTGHDPYWGYYWIFNEDGLKPKPKGEHDGH